tara:strand:- start:4568 stop:4741 length:174 start_codon:yes stop_codon:yes gene_type:complete
MTQTKKSYSHFLPEKIRNRNLPENIEQTKTPDVETPGGLIKPSSEKYFTIIIYRKKS